MNIFDRNLTFRLKNKKRLPFPMSLNNTVIIAEAITMFGKAAAIS